jgi:hypothetical protein
MTTQLTARPKRVCDLEDCGRPHVARGFCRRHYENWHRTVGTRECTQPRCPAPAIAQGLCSRHYKRWSRHGDPTKKRARSTCLHGHPYNALNTRFSREGKRYCVPCKRNQVHRHRVQVAVGGSDAVDLDVLLTQHGHACPLCGLPLDRSKPWPHPQSASIDHIIPLSRGGAHVDANCQPAHLKCNQSKGTTIRGTRAANCKSPRGDDGHEQLTLFDVRA